MKNIKIFAALAICAMALVSCGKMLDVHNPNYFTDEEMQNYLNENPDASDQILTGLTASLYNRIGLGDAACNGGYSNSGMYESYKAFQRICQAGDIVEGDAVNTGTFATWYQNLPSNTYWETSKDSENYGYYYAAVLKIGPAQKALDFLTKEYVEKNPSLGYARAQALIIKALGYTELMERYTDLSDVTSETKQGWPIYDLYAYNAPLAPLSVKATWEWIMGAFNEAAQLLAASSLGDGGYTFGTTDSNLYFDLDLGVCQYYRCRAALDCKDWATVIAAGEDLLRHYTTFIKAEDYGMPASQLANVQRKGVTDDKPYGTGWAGEWPADKNGLICSAKNPETIFGNGTPTGSTQYWSVLGLNTVKNSPSGYYQMDQALYESMSDADCRKACVLPSAFDNLVTFSHAGTDTTWHTYSMPAYTSLKWGATCGLGQTDHKVEDTFANSSWCRSSAVLLMVAEAYAQSGKDVEAKATLDKLLAARTLPGQAKMTCDNTMAGKTALEMCQQQWRIEMWGEGDWAFFNRKRWGKSFARGANHWATNDVPSEGWTWQIPQKERQGNPNWN